MECRSFCPGFEGIGKCWHNQQFMTIYYVGVVDLGGWRPQPPLFGSFLQKVTYISQMILTGILFCHLLDSFTKLASSDSGVRLPWVLCCEPWRPSAVIYSLSQGIDGDFSSGCSLQDVDQHRRPGNLKLFWHEITSLYLGVLSNMSMLLNTLHYNLFQFCKKIHLILLTTILLQLKKLGSEL